MVDPIVGASTAIGEVVGKEVSKRLVQQLIDFVRYQIESRSHPSLSELKKICAYLERFVNPPNKTGKAYHFPETKQNGPWLKQRKTLLEILDDWFDVDFIKTQDGDLKIIYYKWKSFAPQADTYFWKGTGNNFDMRPGGVKKESVHRSITKLYPFISVSNVNKAVFRDLTEDIMRIDYPAFFLQMFTEGWKAFIDDNTRFRRGAALLLDNQAYAEGEFSFPGVISKIGKDMLSEEDVILLSRKMLVTETNDSVHLCMTGVPYLESVSNDPYHDHVEKWLREVRLLRNV